MLLHLGLKTPCLIDACIRKLLSSYVCGYCYVYSPAVYSPAVYSPAVVGTTSSDAAGEWSEPLLRSTHQLASRVTHALELCSHYSGLVTIRFHTTVSFHASRPNNACSSMQVNIDYLPEQLETMHGN
jgi:hypothetical protein